MIAKSYPPSPTDLGTTDAVEDAARTILNIRDLEIAAARIALAPATTTEHARSLRAIPVTRGMGIRLSQSIRYMAQIVANSNGAQYFTTASASGRPREKNNFRLQVWKLP